MYSAHNEGKSIVAEDLLETWKIKLVNTWLQFLKNTSLH